MIEIIPAILPKDYEDMKNKIALVRGLVPLAQIDLCDGIFVPSQTWPFSTGGNDDYNFQNIINEKEGMPFWEDIDFELDLMVADAMENFDIYTKLGPKRIIFHIEAFPDLQEFKHFLEGIDFFIRDSIEIGVAINPTTPIEQIYDIANSIDYVQCMAIEKIGYQAQGFSEKVFPQIASLKEKFPDLVIGIDGAVSMQTAKRLIDAGATRLAVGSALFNTTDIIDTLEKFKQIK
ncbi:MAG: hypothetical protein KBD52_01880 [Candidatus Pacebacteria bacterium]|nr:hypothetical protein [Candidatus Paceibacterota bacterium]